MREWIRIRCASWQECLSVAQGFVPIGFTNCIGRVLTNRLSCLRAIQACGRSGFCFIHNSPSGMPYTSLIICIATVIIALIIRIFDDWKIQNQCIISPWKQNVISKCCPSTGTRGDDTMRHMCAQTSRAPVGCSAAPRRSSAPYRYSRERCKVFFTSGCSLRHGRKMEVHTATMSRALLRDLHECNLLI